MTAKNRKTTLTEAQRRAIRDQPEPSAESLRLMPERDFSKAVERWGRGPEAIRAALEYMRSKRGRPKKGTVPAGSRTRSIRFPDAAWASLDRHAKERGMTTHALLREVITEWLQKTG